MRAILVIASLTVSLVFCFGCARQRGRVTQPRTLSGDQSFFHVQPGDQFCMVIPITKSGTSLPQYDVLSQQGTTITLSAKDLLGYETAHYQAFGGRNGKVKIRWISAEESREGKKTANATPTPLPFQLPKKAMYLRLIYLIRASTANHNMAIAGADKQERLESFTAELRRDPGICERANNAVCIWVPSSIAVRPDCPSNPIARRDDFHPGLVSFATVQRDFTNKAR